MKFAAVAAFAVGSALAQTQAVVDKELIHAVNSNPASTWKAGVNSVFVGKTVEEVSSMMGLVLKSPEDTLASRSQNPNPYESVEAVPDSFDSRTQWPGCVHPILNQAQCGSCWAFSSTEALSDRFCIASKGSVNVVLSPQYVVSCDNTDGGCQGGELANVWRFLVNTGTSTFTCDPYSSQNGTVASCPSTCVDGSPIKLYKAKNSYAVGGLFSFGRVNKIQNEILKNGPVQTGFSVYQDFINYKSGVYQHTSGNLLGGHAVKIIGWGTENNTPYWLVANSWGPEWGLQGFFKIKRGDNECGIEADVYAGLPAV